jgi:hypothetical protein
MGTSYVLLLTAFYVDNGKNLPLWQELPQWMFWVLPSAIGGPIIMYTLLRHPLLRQPRVIEAPKLHRQVAPLPVNAVDTLDRRTGREGGGAGRGTRT